ncbi:MAG TPA: PIN domain-containing protein [Longimicrobiales bacterium]|nr:PIN domain-containing protein [Longimicrobiales bacterium]
MIYLDASAALAHLMAEDRRPPASLWDEVLVASRLLDYEVWTVVHARGLGDSHEEATTSLLGRVAFLEMIPEILHRARQPFPTPVRTLDALHLASLEFLRSQGQTTRLASYDRRMLDAAAALRVDVLPLD